MIDLDLTDPTEVYIAAQSRYLLEAEFHAEAYRAAQIVAAQRYHKGFQDDVRAFAAMKAGASVALYVRDASAPPAPQSHKALVEVLIYHYRVAPGKGCGCGWGDLPQDLGGSWPEHVAKVYEQALEGL